MREFFVVLGMTSLATSTGLQGQAPTSATQQSRATTVTKPLQVFGGLANASGGWGVGFGGGLGYTFAAGDLPVFIRAGAEYFRFSDSESGFGVNASATSNTFGIHGLAEYALRTSSPRLVPYLVGGLGLYYQSVSVEVSVPGGGSGAGDDDESSLAIAFGAGLRFSERFFAELRVTPFFAGGTMIPLVAGLRF